jgi:hypothetical protein
MPFSPRGLPLLPIALLALMLLLGACDRGETAQAQAERAEAMAAAGLQRVESSREAGLMDAARIYAEEVLQKYPQTAAAAQLQPQLGPLRAAAEQEREGRRLAELWTYHAVDGEAGTVHTAYIFGRAEQADAPPVRLVLRRHPEWGQNTYLLIGDGADFRCQDECRASLAFDGKPAEDFVITRAKDVDPPAVFLEEDARVLTAVDGAETLLLQVDLADGSAPPYRFELGGFDSDRLGPPVAPTAAQ